MTSAAPGRHAWMCKMEDRQNCGPAHRRSLRRASTLSLGKRIGTLAQGTAKCVSTRWGGAGTACLTGLWNRLQPPLHPHTRSRGREPAVCRTAQCGRSNAGGGSRIGGGQRQPRILQKPFHFRGWLGLPLKPTLAIRKHVTGGRTQQMTQLSYEVQASARCVRHCHLDCVQGGQERPHPVSTGPAAR